MLSRARRTRPYATKPVRAPGTGVIRALSEPSPIKRSVSKTIDAPAEKVFDHWLIPTLVGKWMFGPAVTDETIVELNNKVRPGGEFAYVVKRNGKNLTHQGEFHRIDRPRQLKFSWSESPQGEDLSQYEVNFEETSSRTQLKIQLLLDPKLAENADTIKQLWSARCKALASLLSG